MWYTESLWLEIAIVNIILALGNMFMGHFEERTPKLRKILKYIFINALICTVSYFFGRPAAMILLTVAFVPVLYIHAWYLPFRKGINGWTGEPKAKYYEFRKWDKNIF